MYKKVKVFGYKDILQLEAEVNDFLHGTCARLIDIKFHVNNEKKAEWFYAMVIYDPDKL